MLDVGDLPVEVGDEVVLLGRQGDETITAAEWADARRHDPVRDRVRHRPARPEEVHRVSAVESRARRRSPAPAPRPRLAARGVDGAAGRGRRGCAATPDADARRALETPIYVDHRLDSHDGGTIYVVEAGEGPPIVLSHGVTLSVRTWFHQLELLPEGRLPRDRVRPPWPRRVGARRSGHSLDNLAEDVRSVLTRARPPRRGPRRPLDGRRRGPVVRDRAIPELARERVRGIVLLSTLAKTPFGSRSTQMKARIETIFNRVPDSTLAVGAQEPRLPRRPARLRQGSASESRRARAADDARVPARDAPRRAPRARRPRPDRRPAEDATSRRS